MIYTDGTIAINAGSPIVTGTGTQWKKNIHGVAPGQLISIENGTAPVSMMIRAVNSDTELVLSFNAPVTLSGAKYSIATTVPDTISDAARTMSANQGYIVYFLQAMQQWMTDTGQVEIELPNGQKVTLDSIKALNEAIKNINDKVDGIKIPDATTSQKGVVQLSATVGASTTKVPHEKAINDALESKLNTTGGNITGSLKVGGNDVLLSGSALPMLGAVNGYPTYSRRGVWGAGSESDYAKGINFGGSKDGEASDTGRISITYKGESWLRFLNANGGVTGGQITLIGRDAAFDSNGFLKKSSPIIAIHPDGNYETNDESEGAEVSRTGTGQYHITGILGYNSDGAWGVNGGISVPKDNNGLELVYVADRVLEDGSIIIETCHRQHTHLPERFQNWRLKEITPEGERIFYQDGEPCDLPESTRLDVRVEMPQGSVWNVKQRELAEQMEREQAEREAQENN
ncbi:phage tail fiber protein [Morganella morganii]|uniref:phage tail fiber protein n=1 Tax=Morganella morganii TaxID=582 RepID=UPI00296EEF3E|nr:hypothetical protein [Morganella morganii]WOZ89265.1 hypothetical protein PSP90_04995 [Morganella morganii]